VKCRQTSVSRAGSRALSRTEAPRVLQLNRTMTTLAGFNKMRRSKLGRWKLVGALSLSLLGLVTLNNACSNRPFAALSANGSLDYQSTSNGSSVGISADPSAPFAPPYPANSYFVSPNGSDSNDGRSAATAWQSIAKVNGFQFAAGSFILFQRGGVWRESLKIPSSGQFGGPITFADYGDAGLAKPRLLGSVRLTNSQFQPQGNGIYTYPISSEVYSVLANQTFLLFPQGQPAQNLAGSWSFANGNLTINSINSDPRTDGKIYEAVVREDVIATNAQKHILIQNLVSDETARYGGGYAFRIEQSEDVVINNCEAYRAGKHHFGVINSTGFVGKNLYAAFAMPGQHWQPGDSASAFVSYGDQTGVAMQTSEWNNTVWEHAEDPQSAGNNYYAFFTHGPNIGSVKIRNMVSRQGNLSISNGDSPSATVSLSGGWIDNGRLEVDGSGIVVDGIHISGENGTIDFIGHNLTLQNSLIEGTNLGAQWYQTAIAIRGSNNTIRFNTVVLASNAPTSNACLTFVNKGIGVHIYANILSSPGRAVQLFDSAPLDHATINESHDNLYLATETFAYVSTSPNWHFVDESFADWQASGFDQSAVIGDPGFVNAAAGNFTLGAGSRAVDAIPMGHLGGGVVTDLSGSARLKGSAYDIGAYER
jgi:hypothetical protein